MAKSIQSYLPDYETPTRRIQADIGVTIAEAVDKIRRKKRLTWSEMTNALFEKFVDDLSPKAKPEGAFTLPPRAAPVQTDMFNSQA